MIPYHRPMKIKIDFSDILNSGQFSNGKYCRELEERIGRMYNCKVYVCSSGTQGLLLSIFVFDGAFRTISMPAFNWWSDMYICKLMDIKIEYKDINPKTWLTKKESTNLRLHTFGSCDPYPTDVIFDGTHALGTKLKNLGKATILSLAPTKLITAGEGGIILLKEPSEEIRELRDRCSRMSEFHAKIGLSYLEHLTQILLWKEKVFKYYKNNLEGQFQEVPFHSNYNTIGMLTDLKIPKEIEVKQYYEPLYRGLKNTDYVYSKIVCLPSWLGAPYKKIVDLINEKNK